MKENSIKQKVIIILGQTSTGKSDFAVEVAEQISYLNRSKGLVARASQGEVLGEIISADSRQVYRGMNLGTGKITKKEMRRVHHYLLDVVSPKKTFSVSRFQKEALKKIKEIGGNHKIPIICGGTGFYIDAVVNGNIFPAVPPNKKLRKELYPKSAIALFGYLQKIDPRRAENIDPKNKVRLIRAIEIAKALGKVPEIQISQRSDLYGRGPTSPTLTFLKIGLKLPPEILKKRIRMRLLSRIKKGMITEVKNLHKSGVSWKRMYDLGLEYRYVSMFLQNKLRKEEMIEKLNTEIWHFAKRQNTWFKRDQNIVWIDPSKKTDKAKALKLINKFLKT